MTSSGKTFLQLWAQVFHDLKVCRKDLHVLVERGAILYFMGKTPKEFELQKWIHWALNLVSNSFPFLEMASSWWCWSQHLKETGSWKLLLVVATSHPTYSPILLSLTLTKH